VGRASDKDGERTQVGKETTQHPGEEPLLLYETVCVFHRHDDAVHLLGGALETKYVNSSISCQGSTTCQTTR